MSEPRTPRHRLQLLVLWATFLLVKHLANFSSAFVGGAQDVHMQLPEFPGDSDRLFF